MDPGLDLLGRRGSRHSGAPLGLLVFVRRGEILHGPQGNTFPTDTELGTLLHEARFTVRAQADLGDLDPAPRHWKDRIERVEQHIAAAHSNDARFDEAREQERRITQLIERGQIAGHLISAVAG